MIDHISYILYHISYVGVLGRARTPLLCCGRSEVTVSGCDVALLEAEAAQPVGTNGGGQRTQLSHAGRAALRS